MMNPETTKLNGAMMFRIGARYGRGRLGSLLRSETAATGAKLYMNDDAAVMAPTSPAQLPKGRNRMQPKTPPKMMLNHGTPRRSIEANTGPVPAGETTASMIKMMPSQPRPTEVASW